MSINGSTEATLRIDRRMGLGKRLAPANARLSLLVVGGRPMAASRNQARCA